jgi:hypothetical protein
MIAIYLEVRFLYRHEKVQRGGEGSELEYHPRKGSTGFDREKRNAAEDDG